MLGPYQPFWTDIPLGLTTSIVGIAVGYKTTILPRKLTDIKEYLEGKRDKVPPHFHDFHGTIHKHRKEVQDKNIAVFKITFKNFPEKEQHD